jgi:hypothetical protein
LAGHGIAELILRGGGELLLRSRRERNGTRRNSNGREGLIDRHDNRAGGAQPAWVCDGY